MDFFRVRVKFQESFKDGNVLEGRLFKAGEVTEMSEMDANKVRQSGGVIEILAKLVPNPLKQVEEKPEDEKPVEALPKRKAGRPKRVA